MYHLIKGGSRADNLYLENSETESYLGLGPLSMIILDILHKQENIRVVNNTSTVDLDEDAIKVSIYDNWDITIKDETANLLMKTAAKIKMPKPRKTKVKEIDAMDVLLGRASYK